VKEVIAGKSSGLWIESIDAPTISDAFVDMTFVQTTGAVVPEFDTLRDNAETGPVGWTWDGVSFEFSFIMRPATIEIIRVDHRLALERSPGTKLAVTGAGREILVRFSIGNTLDWPFDANLYFERWPVKAEGGLWVFE
jgi:hypothetical protein